MRHNRFQLQPAGVSTGGDYTTVQASVSKGSHRSWRGNRRKGLTEERKEKTGKGSCRDATPVRVKLHKNPQQIELTEFKFNNLNFDQ